jgi:hypothetical protein
MADDSDADLLERSRKLLIDSAVQHLRMVHEAKVRRPTPPPAPSGIPMPDAGAMSKVASDFLRELARFSLATHESWNTFTKNNFGHIVDALYGGRAPEPPTLTLDMSAARGGIAKKRFVIANPTAGSAVVSFTQPELLSTDGEHRLHMHVIFSRFLHPTADAPCSDMIVPASGEGHFKAAFEVPERAAPGRYCGESTVVVGQHVAGRLRFELTVVEHHGA